MEVLLFPGGYAGLQPIPGGHANLCLVIEKAVYDRLDRDWDGLIDYLARMGPSSLNGWPALSPAGPSRCRSTAFPTVSSTGQPHRGASIA